MKATSVLLQQHRHFEYLLGALETDPAPLLPLLDDIARQLDAHLRVKQEIFYPAVAMLDPSLVLPRYEEHALCAIDLEALLATEPSDASFPARVTALRALLGAHLKAEETHLFPRVERLIDRQRLVELGAALSDRFDQLLREGDRESDAPVLEPSPRNRTGTRPKETVVEGSARGRRSYSAALFSCSAARRLASQARFGGLKSGSFRDTKSHVGLSLLPRFAHAVCRRSPRARSFRVRWR
jgi:hypothetical protein